MPLFKQNPSYLNKHRASLASLVLVLTMVTVVITPKILDRLTGYVVGILEDNSSGQLHDPYKVAGTQGVKKQTLVDSVYV